MTTTVTTTTASKHKMYYLDLKIKSFAAFESVDKEDIQSKRPYSQKDGIE